MTTTSDGLTAPFALARFRDGDSVRLGLVAGDSIRPLSADDLGAADLNAFLAHPDWDRLAALVVPASSVSEPASSVPEPASSVPEPASSVPEPASSVPEPVEGWMPLADVVLTAPVEPRQVLQAGANYRTHVVQLIMAGLTKGGESGLSPDEVRARAEAIMDARAASGRPFIFLGLPQCVVGDDVPLVLPDYSETHDWELELAVVIGREAFRVDPEHALDHVAGYTIVNDITTRDRVFPPDVGDIGADWYRSKNAPGFLPTGPFLVPATLVDPRGLSVKLELNGDVMQDATTAELVFDVETLIAAASQTLPLLPGDLLLTGSPAGNGQHWKRYLRDGDVMTGTIQGLGTQVVRCIAEGPAV